MNNTNNIVFYNAIFIGNNNEEQEEQEDNDENKNNYQNYSININNSLLQKYNYKKSKNKPTNKKFTNKNIPNHYYNKIHNSINKLIPSTPYVNNPSSSKIKTIPSLFLSQHASNSSNPS